MSEAREIACAILGEPLGSQVTRITTEPSKGELVGGMLVGDTTTFHFAEGPDDGVQQQFVVTASETTPPRARVYRVKIRPDEMLKCGWFPEMVDQWGFIKTYLKAKSLPEWCLAERTPVRMAVEDDGVILLEFEG